MEGEVGFASLGVVSLPNIVEKRIVVVVEVVDADLEDALPVFLVRFNKLHADVEMVERLHAKVVLLAVVFDVTHIVVIVILLRDGEAEVAV